MKYIIHLKVDYYDPKKKEKKNDVEAAKKVLIDNAKKDFALAIGSYSKAKEIVILNEEYAGQTFGVAVYVDIKKEKIDDVREALRRLDIVDIIEPEYGA